MTRFKPKDLREAVALEIALSQGWESADMVRKRLPLAGKILELVAGELGRFVIHDEEGALECIRAAASGAPFEPPCGWHDSGAAA